MCVRRSVSVGCVPYGVGYQAQNKIFTGRALVAAWIADFTIRSTVPHAPIFFLCVPIFLSHSHALSRSPHSLQHNRTLHTNIGLLRTHTCKQFAIYSICIQIEIEQRDGNRPNALFIVNRFLANERQVHQPAIHKTFDYVWFIQIWHKIDGFYIEHVTRTQIVRQNRAAQPWSPSFSGCWHGLWLVHDCTLVR